MIKMKPKFLLDENVSSKKDLIVDSDSIRAVEKQMMIKRLEAKTPSLRKRSSPFLILLR